MVRTRRDLPPGVALGRAQVAAVDLHQPLDGDQPDPEEDRHRPVAGVVGQPIGRVEVRFLEDIGRVDAPPEPAVEPEPDHLVQLPTIPLPQGPECRTVTGRGGPNEFGVVWISVHEALPTGYMPSEPEFGQKCPASFGRQRAETPQRNHAPWAVILHTQTYRRGHLQRSTCLQSGARRILTGSAETTTATAREPGTPAKEARFAAHNRGLL
jgi:hypothetical protein